MAHGGGSAPAVDSRRAWAWELPGSEGKVAGWSVWKEGGLG